ncbi:hypothetical protein [Vibrio sp. TRT 1302]|uniref:hypothetical protein n=1 Tax=Vibrio sp. TRT 1302 TaxID=3418504 RepID=UPI003CE6BA07
MSNRRYLLLCILVVTLFSIIEVFKKDGKFLGKVSSSSCVETGKSELSIKLIATKDTSKRTYYFGVKDELCRDAIKRFTPESDILIFYRSINGWFTDVEEVYLNGKKIPLRTYSSPD